MKEKSLSNGKSCEEHGTDDPNCNCRYCGLDMDEHDGSGCCPPGTEEYGGRR